MPEAAKIGIHSRRSGGVRMTAGSLPQGPGPGSLSVVLPAFGESRSLATLLPKLLAAAGACAASFEILVVDTRGTFDDTSAVCRRFGVHHVRQSGGDDYGDAVRTGIAQARGDYILFMDADGSHDPGSIAAMWASRRGCDIVIGSRYVSGGHTENGPLLVAMSHLLGLAFRMTFHLPVADATTSFRLYRGDVLRKLTLRANGFDILQEILLEALSGAPRARIVEIPVTFVRRIAGKSKRKLIPLAFAYVTTFARLKRFHQADAFVSH